MVGSMFQTPNNKRQTTNAKQQTFFRIFTAQFIKRMSVIADQKPIIGFSCGDINGIGIELIIKVLNDNRILDICTPVVFANNKAINFYRKSMCLFTLLFFCSGFLG